MSFSETDQEPLNELTSPRSHMCEVIFSFISHSGVNFTLSCVSSLSQRVAVSPFLSLCAWSPAHSHAKFVFYESQFVLRKQRTPSFVRTPRL